MIHIVGLGPGDFGQITLETLTLLEGEAPIYLRTAVHPSVADLTKRGVTFKSFDALYEEKNAFEGVYATIVDTLVAAAKKGGDLVYGVPGNPLCAETSVTLLTAACKREGIPYHLYSGVSFIDVSMASVEADPVEGLKVIDAFMIKTQHPDKTSGNLITQVYSQHIASEVKLALSDIYDDEVSVALIINGGIQGQEMVKWLPLYTMDRVAEINHLTSLYIPPQVDDPRDYQRLIQIMEILRGPDGCSWDKKQTHESLKQYLLEETYEVIDAIEADDVDNLVEELGDVLFQVVFHAQLGREAGLFTINDVIEGVNRKMVRRHPHVFVDNAAISPEEVVTNWEAIKETEKEATTLSGEMEGIPAAFTALLTANKIQSKAGKVGFDWKDPREALLKVSEEAQEVLVELEAGNAAALEEELGDLLFAVVNVARLAGVSPELALKKANVKFVRRFKAMENMAREKQKSLKDYDLDGLEGLWQAVKALEMA